MKIRIQLLSSDKKELNQRIAKLDSFCKLLKLPVQKVENRHYDDTFLIPISNDDHSSHWQINGILAFCFLNDFLYDFVDDEYPGF